MLEKLTNSLNRNDIELCYPDRWKYDERKYFYCDFLKIDEFVECVKSFWEDRRSPILIMEQPEDGWNFSGMERPKETVVILALCLITPNILIRLFLKDDYKEGLRKRLEIESAQEAEALGGA